MNGNVDFKTAREYADGHMDKTDVERGFKYSC